MSKFFKEGNNLRKAEDWNGAVKAYTKAIKEEPENAQIYICIGLCFHKTKKYSQSEKAYKKVLELTPKDISALKV